MKVILDDDGRPLAVDVVIDAYLNGLGRTGLRALVLDLAASSAEAQRVPRLRASPAARMSSGNSSARSTGHSRRSI